MLYRERLGNKSLRPGPLTARPHVQPIYEKSGGETPNPWKDLDQ